MALHTCLHPRCPALSTLVHFLPYIYIYIYVYIHALGWARHLLTAIIRPSIYLLICPMYSDVESILVLPPGRSPTAGSGPAAVKAPTEPSLFSGAEGRAFVSVWHPMSLI